MHKRDGNCAYKILIGTLEQKRQLGRRSRRWEVNIQMDTKDTGEKM
jgi:hypothetical protein